MNDSLSIRFLGTGTLFPDPHRSCSATLLDLPRTRILIDIGAGTLRRMAEFGVAPESINYIFLTHFHPDHISDLAMLLFTLRNLRRPDAPAGPLCVWGPQGLFRFVQGLERSYGKWFQFEPEEVRFYELRRRLLDFPGFRVIWDKVLHTQESVGYRFEAAGRVMAFSGDSGYCQELIRLCAAADLAVIECSHADQHAVKGHLSPSLAAKIAQEAGVRKIVFNHFYPDVLQEDPLSVAAKYFGGDILLANDGDVIELDGGVSDEG